MLANITLKYTPSNSVAAAFGQVIGIGAGQQNRVDCVQIVKKKSKQLVSTTTSQSASTHE